MNGLDRRDEQLRRSLLTLINRLGGRNVGGWIVGSQLSIAARDADGGAVDSDEHTERLLEDLKRVEVIDEKDAQPTERLAARDLRHRQFKTTTLGWRLLMDQVDPIAGIAGKDDA